MNNQQQVPIQAQSLMNNYQQLQGESQKEQWARNLAKQAGINDEELNRLIQDAQTKMQSQPNQATQPMNMQTNLLNGMTQQIMAKLMGGFKL